MLFPTITFATFFMVVLAGNWLLMRHRFQWKCFMLAASYVFYGAWDYRFIALLVGSTVVNQVFAEWLHRASGDRARRLILTAAVAANLGGLAYFKYYGFLVETVVNGSRSFGLHLTLPLPEVVLPVGISFFTFQALSYVVDVYRREISPATPLDFAVYLAFFPHLVAGPIVRASELVPQLGRARDPRRIDASRAFYLIFAGLFKKLVIASYLSTQLVDGVFELPGQHSSVEVLVGIYAYAVQIYADFSGYTDIAIGCALLLGFQFPQNFDSPYSAQSLQDFWRRWHITLSRWLRDYLYIPLGGSKGRRLITYRNLILTMVLGGLWHGAAATFVVWGAIHGVGLAFERLRADRRRILGFSEPPDTGPSRFFRRLITFHIVCLAWVFFRADSLGAATRVLGRLFSGWGPVPTLTPAVLAAIAVVIVAQYVPQQVVDRTIAAFSRLSPVTQGTALGLALVAISILKPGGVAPFIYFQF